MKNFETEKIFLIDGFVDKANNTHKEIEISKLITAQEFFFIEMIWGQLSPTALSAYLLNHGITKFGDLKTPVSTDILLNLYSDDFENLVNAYNRFIEQNGLPTAIDEKNLKLVVGLEIEGVLYDVAEFGNLLKGIDEVEAESRNLTEKHKYAFLAGKQVCRLKQSSGNAVLEGSLSLETVGRFYLIDVVGLIGQSELWKTHSRNLRKSENK